MHISKLLEICHENFDCQRRFFWILDSARDPRAWTRRGFWILDSEQNSPGHGRNLEAARFVLRPNGAWILDFGFSADFCARPLPSDEEFCCPNGGELHRDVGSTLTHAESENERP